MAMADPPNEGLDEAAATLKAAHKLLKVKDSDVEKRWQKLNDDDLVPEIQSYRTYIDSIGALLERFGEASHTGDNSIADEIAQSEENQQAGPSRQSNNPETSGNYTASVDDLDPSEWQVRCATIAFGTINCLCADAVCSACMDRCPRLHTATVRWPILIPSAINPKPETPSPPCCPRQVPSQCIPIHANVTTYDWKQLYEHIQFDVIMMDPPWQLATANPTRGVALSYSQLTDADICALPVPKLQQNGFLFVWVINAKYKFTLDLFEKWGYQ